MSVDWVGSGPDGRPDDENTQVLRRFCPPKNHSGVRPWSLNVLVCVGMAGEGMDIRDATEAVFLTSPGIHNTSKQNIGRLSRVVPDYRLTGIVNVDAASDWAEYRGESVMRAMDATNGPPPDAEEDDDADQGDSPAREYEPIPPGPIVKIEDVLLVDILSDPEFIYIKDAVAAEALRRGMPHAEADQISTEAALRYKKKNDERFNATYQRESAARQLNARVRKVAGLAMRISQERMRETNRDLPGDFMKRINTAKRSLFGAVEASTPDELERQNDWVRNLEAALLRGEIPSWL
jgi:superfamily II DNA or RNA helicase